MRSDFHFHFYSRIVIMAVLAVSLFFIQQSVRSKAQFALPLIHQYDIGGWGWNSQTGWLSLNCYNDFYIPGKYESKCIYPYKLNVGALGTNNFVEGCAWIGNDLSGGTSPLGWVCFSDPDDNGYTMASSSGVATSTIHLNALENSSTTPNAFASIVSQEKWECSAITPNPGAKCSPSTEITDCGLAGNTCVPNTTYDAWKLGFPIANPVDDAIDSDSPRIIPSSEWWRGSLGKSIDGCFNCYEEEEWRCSATNQLCGSSGSGTDGLGGCGDYLGEPQTCTIKKLNKKCDNCLEYFYYSGKCGTDPIDQISNSLTDCTTDVDCTESGETCQNISTCSDTIGTTQENVLCIPSSCSASTCVSHEIGDLRKVIGAYNCGICEIEDYDNTCSENTKEANLNSCGVCETAYYTPGVMIDNKHGRIYDINDPAYGETANLCGWGWNGYDSDLDGIADKGFGWFQFGPRVVTSTKPYIFAKSGNIYSQKNITGYLPPFGSFNSLYLIESGGSISNFVSSSTVTDLYEGERPYSPIIAFPQLDANTNKYTNALGTIDYFGLVNDFSGNSSNINKYGASIVKPTVSLEGFFSAPAPFLFEGSVIYYETSQNINTEIHIEVGTGIKDASGIIVINNGDLTINTNVVYETSLSYDKLKNIPSVVWIIKGDLLIGPNVTELAGTFIVLGDVSRAADCNPVVDGCGQVVTCYGATAAECAVNSLTINGNVIARYFNLGRTKYEDTLGNRIPSEVFVNDGHLQANPPAGFEDFSNLIPRFTEN